MKKTILALVLLVGFSSINAIEKSNEILVGKYTFEQCDAYATVFGYWHNLSHEQEYNVFAACMDIE